MPKHSTVIAKFHSMNVEAETKPKQSTVFCRSILMPLRIQFKAKRQYVSVEEIIPDSFHVLHVSARWVSQNLSAHDRHWRVASSHEPLGSCTSDKELVCRRFVAGDKT